MQPSQALFLGRPPPGFGGAVSERVRGGNDHATCNLSMRA